MKTIATILRTALMALVAVVALGSCESDDQYLASQLTGRDWQGYLGAYYYDRWGVTGDEYRTVMRFASSDSWATSGRGYELDYDTRSGYRYQNYAYCQFSWAIVDGDIILIYDDDRWSPVYILNYRLTSSSFSGRIDDNTRRDIVFEFYSETFSDWDRYRNGSYWDYYYGRTRNTDDTPAGSADVAVPYVDNGKSILSGTFAEGLK